MSDLPAVLATLSVPDLIAWGKEALDRAGTFPEVRKVKATAAAIETFVKASKGSEEAILVAQTIKARADRKTAEAYKDLEKSRGGRPEKTGLKSNPVSKTATLTELGIDKNEAERLRILGEASREQFEAGLEALRDAGELTEDGMKKLMRDAVRSGMGEAEIKATVAAVKAKRAAKRTPEEKARLADEDAGIDTFGLDGLDYLWTKDPAACARGIEPLLRPGRLAKALACRRWLDLFITELEGSAHDAREKDAA